MICPACKNPMIVVEYHKTELDYCGKCHGVWFDAGELELLLEQSKVTGEEPVVGDLLKVNAVSSGEKKRRCPICRRQMKKVNVAGASHVLIDACVREDGLWFDGGEVDHLVKFLSEKSPEKSGQAKVFSFIKEVLSAR